MSNKGDARRIQRYLNNLGIASERYISSRTGTVYIKFPSLAFANYVIRISDHSMKKDHILKLEGKTVFNVGEHKYADGEWRACCQWIDNFLLTQCKP
jgi:hypothetical protein